MVGRCSAIWMEAHRTSSPEEVASTLAGVQPRLRQARRFFERRRPLASTKVINPLVMGFHQVRTVRECDAYENSTRSGRNPIGGHHGRSWIGVCIYSPPRSTEFATEAEQRIHSRSGSSAAGSGEYCSHQVQIAAAPELRTAWEELQLQNDRLQLLLNLMKQITSSLDLHEVLRSISANLREVMHGDIASVSLHDTASGKFRLFVLDFPKGNGLVKEGLLMPLIGPGKRAFETLHPVIASIEDLYELGPEVHAELASLKGTKSICLIPLVNRGRVLGILMIGRTTGAPFAEEEVEFLDQVAGPITIAIENALAYDEISDLKDKLAGRISISKKKFAARWVLSGSSGTVLH